MRSSDENSRSFAPLRMTISLGILLCGMACAQNLPAGTHSAGDTSQQDAMNARIAAAEDDLDKQDYAAATAKLKVLLGERPKDARVLYDLGFAEERNGDEAGAADAYAGAIAADPALGQPRIALGLLDARAGRLEKAHADLQAAANMSAEAPVLRGRALRALARMDAERAPDAARGELIQAVKLTEETPDDVLLSADLAAQVGDDADAEAAYRRAMAMDGANVDAMAGLTHVLVKEKKIAEAESLLAAALRTHPDDPRIVSQLAVLYASEDKAAQAIPLMEKLRASRKVYAEDVQMTAMLARLYMLNGDNAKAEAMYGALVAKDASDPALLDDLGSVLVKEQKYADAEAALTRAVVMREAFATPEAWGVAAEHLAFAASKNGHPQVALVALKDRATVLPNSPSSLFLEAISHDALHERKEAALDYKAFLAVADGKFPNEEFEARHRLVALNNMK